MKVIKGKCTCFSCMSRMNTKSRKEEEEMLDLQEFVHTVGT